jgi:peptidoglycan hydrolase CwlO-like protein
MIRFLDLRRAAAIGALTALAAAIPASPSRGDLAGRFQAGQQRAGALQSAIQQDSTKINGFEGTIASLQGRLRVIQGSLDTQEQLLREVSTALLDARHRLTLLRADYTRDRRLLATQLVADYESPQPGVIDVVVSANGFDDLLNRLSSLTAVARTNARAIRMVDHIRQAVAVQTSELTRVERRRRQATAAVLVERDDVVQLRLSIVNRELIYAHDRDRKSRELGSLHRTLARESAVLERQAAAAEAASFSGGVAPVGACASTPFVSHGGASGFFPAPGTDYSVGQEPIIAARLDALGRALQLHLIGISGYRSPQHSVEVGGFADDPHTQGLASDTPGVEGVPEATLERFCLTRPFPGPREADHIQER